MTLGRRKLLKSDIYFGEIHVCVQRCRLMICPDVICAEQIAAIYYVLIAYC